MSTAAKTMTSALHARGRSGVAIAREVGLERQTLMRELRRGDYPERRVGTPRARLIARNAEYLARRSAEGCHNARWLEQNSARWATAGGAPQSVTGSARTWADGPPHRCQAVQRARARG
jgi:IS30 family transposase